MIQIILQEDFPQLGFVGDIVKVRPGYARNFLFPKKIAVPLESANVRALEHQRRLLEIKRVEKKKEAEAFKAKIQSLKISIEHASQSGRLFGSVTTTEIQQALEQNARAQSD